MKFQTCIVYYYTDIYFDISCEEEGGLFIFRLIAWGGLRKFVWTLGGYKKTSHWKKNPLHPPVAYIMNAALAITEWGWEGCEELSRSRWMLMIIHQGWKSRWITFSEFCTYIFTSYESQIQSCLNYSLKMFPSTSSSTFFKPLVYFSTLFQDINVCFSL